MLVLSRKRGDAIQIGDEIRITVVKIERNGVRLGIEAPRGISIIREELLVEADASNPLHAWNMQPAADAQPVS